MIIKQVGAGGIGSFLANVIADLMKKNQVVGPDGKQCGYIAYDPDEVEPKNLMYQDFTKEDVFELKVNALAVRHKVLEPRPIKVESFKNIIAAPDDLIISCVDNAPTRKIMFEEMDKLPNMWIDLRCHGRMVAYYVKSKKNTLAKMLATLPEKVEKGEDSCQRQSDLDAGIIQMGNRIIANIGAQVLLNVIRRQDYASSYIASI